MKKRAYLFQPQYAVEISQTKNYWLPYSAGCLWSYAQQFQDITNTWELCDIIYRRENPQHILERMHAPDYCGFSCYVWNRRYCLDLAKSIKQRWPSCVIQFGGPESNGRLLKFDFVDSIVMAEGEESFVDTLRKIAQREPVLQLTEKKRLQDLEIPSPYLTGIFDKIMQENPDVDWAMTLETNRGCPYACTFCDWGGVTYSKIKKFSLERVAQELEWCSQNAISYIFCADANFGIFRERDLTIAKMIRSAADRGQLETVSLQYAKNSTEIIFEIAKIMGDLGRGVTISMQSMNESTLKAIKRDNLEINDMRHLLSLSERTGVGSYTEMIIGLPEETLGSWKTSIGQLLELGQHYSIDIWFAQLLENSELNSYESRLRYGIKTIQAQDYMTLYSKDDYQYDPEIIDLVNCTNTMSTDDIIEGYMYALMVINFHINGYTQIWARYCRDILNVGYREFYDRLCACVMDHPILATHFQEMHNLVSKYLHTGIMYDQKQKGHALHVRGLDFLFDNRDHCYSIGKTVAESFGRIESTVDQLQRHFLYDPIIKYPIIIDCNYDISIGSLAPTKYTIQNQIVDPTNFDFYRERRRGSLKNKIIQKP